MAPEVLRLEPFNEKCDVYSLGILLWCLVTEEEPFEEFEEFEPFFRAVCFDNLRPQIPDNIPKRLSELIESCWHPNPKKRPSCAEIVHSLYHVMVEVAVNDLHGVEFWKKHCLDRGCIYWEDFVDIFLEEFVYLPSNPTKKQLENAAPFQLSELSARDVQSSALVCEEWKRRTGTAAPPSNIADFEQEFEIQLKCLKALLSIEEAVNGDTEMVNLEKFGELCELFGPIRDDDGNSRMLDRIVKTLKNEAFHGDISAVKAQEILVPYNEPGTFLIRFSSIHGQYAITRIDEKGNPVHARLFFKVGEGFNLHGKYYPSINELIEAAKPLLKLSKPCPGSKYQSLFTENINDYQYCAEL